MVISYSTLLCKKMNTNFFTTFILLSFLLLLLNNINATLTNTLQEPDSVQRIRLQRSGSKDVTLANCLKLYQKAKPQPARLISDEDNNANIDTLTPLSRAAMSHRSCTYGLEEKMVKNLKNITTSKRGKDGNMIRQKLNTNGILGSWDPKKDKANIVVAKDGSGNYKTINEAVRAASKISPDQRGRFIIYVKKGVYVENVAVGFGMNNLMFVGDGIQNTIVTSGRSNGDGYDTANSATFRVSGDGFWARDMTFENAAGPDKKQAVALLVESDKSIFYRCSIKGYQDTLFAALQRHIYRDCEIYGTIDFIFGNATAVFQNCDIYVRRPLDHQYNIITAHGRYRSDQITGFSIVNSRIKPAPEFAQVKNQFKSYLGRPWGSYSRTVVLNSDIDELIAPEGWSQRNGDFGLNTLYYGEYKNFGKGSITAGRVKWPGFHVITDPKNAELFTASKFINGDTWIPQSGIPYSGGIF